MVKVEREPLTWSITQEEECCESFLVGQVIFFRALGYWAWLLLIERGSMVMEGKAQVQSQENAVQGLSKRPASICHALAWGVCTIAVRSLPPICCLCLPYWAQQDQYM